MPIVDDVRKYADTAIGQGRTAPARAQQMVSGLGEDTRSRTAGAVTEVRELTADLLEVARRQIFAALGAGDLIVERLTNRAEELPADTARTIYRLVDSARDTTRLPRQSFETVAAVTRAVAEQAQAQVTGVAKELLVRGEETLDRASSFDAEEARIEVTGELDSRLDQVRAGFDALADRGERVAAELRREPMVLRILGDADDVTERTAEQVVSLAESVRDRASANRRSVSGRRAAASRVRNPRRPATVTTAQDAASAATSVARATGTRATGTGAASGTKAPGRKVAGTRAPARRAAGVKAPAGKATGTAARTTTRTTKASAGKATGATARKTTARKAPTRTTSARKTSARTEAATSSTAEKTTARKAPASKATARKAPATKATARKATARKAPATKATARKATARKATARKAPARTTGAPA